jgi:hypothetical protein
MDSIIFNKWFELIDKNTSLKQNEIFFEKIYSPSSIDVYLSIDFYKNIEIYFSFYEKDLKDIKFDQYVGLDFRINKLTNLSDVKTFLIISKNKGFNDEIFLALISSIYDSLTKQTDSFNFFQELKLILKNFKNFFEKSKTELNQSNELGLFGELLFLDRLIQEKDEDVINFWMGPNRSRHDFEVLDIGYEIKSTLKQKNVSISISSEVQLEKNNLNELNLVLYTLEKNANGISLLELAQKLIHKFSSVKNKTLYKANLLRLGFDIDNNINDQNYKVLKSNILKVEDDFPKITKSSIDKNIFDVKYKINIDHLL